MRTSYRLRQLLVALIAIVVASLGSAANAGSGTVQLSWIKGGWIIGGSGGTGTLSFHGRRYPLSIGGISGGLVFGIAKANLYGQVRNISRASDIAGVYAAAGAGLAVGAGPGTVVLQNDKGAILELHGSQTGLLVNVDLSGLAISLK